MNLQNPEKKYRPIPFWSWNEKLNTEETGRQIALMDEAGIGGYFMHARGGLQTEYMGKEWFENIEKGAACGRERGMRAWAYDENGWPSGFGSGIVNGRGIAFQQKYLRIEEGEKQTEHTIINCGGYHLYYEVNPFYVDTLDKDVIKVFIEEIYQTYYNKMGDGIEGFFTDEPQISRNGIPWSFCLEGAYREEYGEELLPKLPELFYATGEYQKTRFQFWKLVTNLFAESFCKQIYEWCDAHGMKLTGHMVLEESLRSQLASNGAVMPHYEYFHIPGMDWLGRQIEPKVVPLQVSSVAHQLGKKQILSETFALTGWNTSFEELRWIFEWQMVRGITLLCPHLEGYSLRGIRKRDYPASFFYQQPWWKDYPRFLDAVSRIGMLLSEGKVKFDTLILHPQSSAWLCYDDNRNEGIEELNRSFYDDLDCLEQKHILFHIGDETILERHGHVEGKKLIVGTQEYTRVILPKHLVFFENTEKLLKEFAENGGLITTAQEAEPNPVLDNPFVTYTEREFADYKMYYLVNSTDQPQEVRIKKGTCVLDIATGETCDFTETQVLPPRSSLVVLDGVLPQRMQKPNLDQEKAQKLPLDGEWEITKCDQNALTLDYCDYWFDGNLIEEHGHISSIQTKACNLGREVLIDMKFRVKAESVPEEVYLVCETPEIFEIKVNGREFVKQDCGFYFDSSFRKMNLAGYLMEGENRIDMRCRFKQSEAVYKNIEKAKVFESELNKLTYDMEIESIYLVGDFSVKTEGNFTKLSRGAVRYDGGFIIGNPGKTVELCHLEQQGFPFFAGSITLRKKFRLEKTDYVLSFAERNATVVKASVNGEECGTIVWKPYAVDLSENLKKGENTIEITLTNSLRNLLGPHHLTEGECYKVVPASFFREDSIWGRRAEGTWDDRYCFMELGMEAEEE